MEKKNPPENHISSLSDQKDKESQTRYNILVEENEAGIFYLNNDRIVYANTAFANVLGASRDKLLGTSILDNVGGKDRQILQEGLEKIKIGEEDRFSQDLELRRGEEEDIYFSLHLKVHARQETFVEIIGASRDATSRVRRSKELTKMKSRFEALYHKMVDGIIIYDYVQEKIIEFNDAALRILDYDDPKDLLKLNRYDLIPKQSTYFPGIDLHNHTKNHGFRVIDGEAFNTPGILNANKGKQILANMTVVPTFHRVGEAFVIFHDTTSKILAEEAKKKSDKKYREINKELKKYIDSNLQLENFAYFASHDLQTPLRSTISFTQLLQRKLKGRLSDEEQEYMDYIIRSSKNMRELINDLLSFSRVNTSKIKLTKTPIKEILFELGSELDKGIPDKDAKIFLHKLPLHIYADPTKIRQIFQNLLSNAVKFSKPDVLLEVNIRCEDKDDRWRFFVQDNGIGIAPEFHDKIFLLFKRLHTNAEYSGTGIGLAMVKKLVEQHEGEIGLESEAGEGATFWFTIAKEEVNNE